MIATADSGEVDDVTGSVFISYASRDLAVAEQLCAALEAASLPCRIAPRDVRAGESYAAAIVSAINSCQALVLILSQHAIESPHVLREVERASSKRRPVLAIRIDKAGLPPDLEYFLSSTQWLDATGEPIERILPRLIESVRGQDAAQRRSGTVPAPRPATPSSRWRNSALVATFAVTALGLAYILADRFWMSKRVDEQRLSPMTAPAISDKSVAVLPLVNMSGNDKDSYLGDGISGEILSALSNVPGLKVIGRASSFRFRS